MTGVVGNAVVPALLQARAEILSAETEACGRRLLLRGIGPSLTEWQGEPGRTYGLEIHADDNSAPVFWQDVQADDDGLFSIEVPMTAGEATSVLLTTPCP